MSRKEEEKRNYDKENDEHQSTINARDLYRKNDSLNFKGDELEILNNRINMDIMRERRVNRMSE